VAAKHGLLVTFMAKPFTQHAGSGMHLHVSLVDDGGVNLFAAADPAGSPLLRQALGGLHQTMAESLLVFAPNGNSYRRFQNESYAPTAVSWGINNRSVSLRVPTGPGIGVDPVPAILSEFTTWGAEIHPARDR
jgi:glutamine synthetase